MLKPPTDTMPANQFGQLRAYLAQPPNSVSQAEINEAVGTAAGGRTRLEVAGELVAWLKTRPASGS